MKNSRAQHGSDERAGGYRTHSLHIATLFAFAVAQPLFDLAGRHPEFLVAHGMRTTSLVIFALALALAFPITVCLLLLLLGKLSQRLESWMAALLVGLLSGVLVLQVFARTIPAPGPLLVTEAVGLGLGVAWLYTNSSQVRLFLTVLSPSILIFPLMFIFSSRLITGDSGRQPLPSVDSQTPVGTVRAGPAGTAAARGLRVVARGGFTGRGRGSPFIAAPSLGRGPLAGRHAVRPDRGRRRARSGSRLRLVGRDAGRATRGLRRSGQPRLE